MAHKRALLVGINNYKNSNFNLRGCLNDIDSLVDVLVNVYRFASEDLIILKDNQATRDAILAGLRTIFAPAAAGDVVVFGYSAHGTQLSNPDDAKIVEAIVPYETTNLASLISNHEINDIVRKAIDDHGLARKVNYTAIYDCCHSGMMYRTLTLDERGEIAFDDSIINRVIDLSLLLPEDGVREIALNDTFQVFSACHHDQTAADMRERPSINLNVPRGAFSFALHNLMRAKPDIAVGELEAQLPGLLTTLVKPHIQEPLFAVQDGWGNSPIFTIP